MKTKLLLVACALAAHACDSCDPPPHCTLIATVSGKEVDFGPLSVGGRVTVAVQVVNYRDSTAPTTAKAMLSVNESDAFSIEGPLSIEVQPGDPGAFLVAFHPRGLGRVTGTLEVSVETCESGPRLPKTFTVELSGVGDCASCNSPPQPMCEDASTSLSYAPTGICEDGRCSYQSERTRCPTGCDPATGQCRGGDRHQLLVIASGPGDVTSSPSVIACPGMCTAQLDDRATIALTAVPRPGAQFRGWTAACQGTAECRLVIRGPTTVGATFTAAETFSLRVALSGTGMGVVTSTSGIDCGATCSAALPPGTRARLVATPRPGSTFAGWTGGGCTGTGICTVTVDADKIVTAEFAAPRCGNGVVEAGEMCDGTNLNGSSCMLAGFSGGILGCSPDCTLFDMSRCWRCGNAAVDPGERCDGANLDGHSCLTEVGRTGGTLRCNATCSGFDTSMCPRCGDGTLDPGETCDGASLNGGSCISEGARGGTIRCNVACTGFDTRMCLWCGNGTIDAGEVCDGTNLGTHTCMSEVGRAGGTLRCNATCNGFDTSMCPRCGDGTIDAGEMCDGASLGTHTCLTEVGRAGGTLRCNATCNGFDTSMCPRCGDGTIDAGEMCDGTNLGGATCASVGQAGGVLACTAQCAFDFARCFRCGNGRCERDATGAETIASCPQDCVSCDPMDPRGDIMRFPHRSAYGAAVVTRRPAGGGPVAGAEERLFVITGYGITQVGNPGELWEWDYTVRAWAQRANLLRPTNPTQLMRSNFVAAATSQTLGGELKIFIIGGCDNPVCPVEKYTPSTNPLNLAGQWNAAGMQPVTRISASGVAGCDGRIYIFGGRTRAGQLLNEVDIYDPVSETYMPSAGIAQPAANARFEATAILGSDCRIYIAGGKDPALQYTNTVSVYDTTTGWLPPARGLPNSVTTPAGAGRGATREMYVFGGELANGVFTGATSYNSAPATGLWSNAAPMPTPRGQAMAAYGRDGRFYVVGGYNSGQQTDVVEVYCPDTNQWR